MLRRAALAGLLALAGCGAENDGASSEEVPAGAVALVHGEPIAREDFDHWLAVAASEHDTGSDRGVPGPGAEGYAALRDEAMRFLIGSEWVEREAAAQGVRVRAATVRRSFEDRKERSFPREADYREFLAASKQTEDGLLLRVRVDLLSSALRERAGKRDGGREGALERFVEDFREEYRERTVCAEGFETAECSNGPGGR